MKITFYIIFTFILLLSSCNEIENETIQGYWIAAPISYYDTNLPEIEFNNNDIVIVDNNSFRRSEKYLVENNKLKIKSVAFDLTIPNNASDTIYLNNIKYVKQESKLKLDEYHLLGITTDQKLSKISNQIIPLHCYRNSQGVFKTRVGDKYVDIENLKSTITPSHSYPEIALFIGENIELSDLKEVYYELFSLNIRKAILVVNYHFPNEYEIFQDNIEIWWNDINDYYLDKNSPPLPRVGFRTKSEVLKNDFKIINIKSKKDIKKIEKLKIDSTYFISINENLIVSNYIELKQLISNLRINGFSIGTEIVKINEN